MAASATRARLRPCPAPQCALHAARDTRLNVKARLCAGLDEEHARLARASPSSVVTARFSTRSVLLPTSTTTTSLPRSARTSSIHRVVFTNEAWSARRGKAAE